MSNVHPRPVFSMHSCNPIIVAIDVSDRAKMNELAAVIAPHAGMLKIGLELFTNHGPAIVTDITSKGGRVMLDLKLHDIPNTVKRAAANAAGLGVELLTIHAGGGGAMVRAAREGVAAGAREAGMPRPKLLAVTVLTSIDQETLSGELGVRRSVGEQVVALARMAQAAGADGVVASPKEIKALRAACGRDFLIVTPGIRPAGAAMDDQKRTMTPGEAAAAGANYIVVGRPVVQAADPVAVLEAMLEEMAHAS